MSYSHAVNTSREIMVNQRPITLCQAADYSQGRFLAAILSDLYKWHGDEQLYLSENRTKIGGKTVYLPGMQQRNLASKIVVPENLLDWNGFHVVVRKWHRKLGKVSFPKIFFSTC